MLEAGNFTQSFCQPKVYTNGKEQIKKQLKDEDCRTVAVQMDGWSAHHYGYIGVIITFITKNWRRVILALDKVPFDESHTAPAQAELVQNIMEKWGLQTSFIYLTTDSATNMTTMDWFLQVDAEMIKCLNHVLQKSKT